MRGLVVILCTLLLAPTMAAEPLRLSDDTGREIVLPGPARRIVSLAPHVTELLFAAGAGELVVGVDEFSDHPPTARALPRVGRHAGLDVEAILALRDLAGDRVNGVAVLVPG